MHGRTFQHWTPRYLIDRLAEKLYRRQHPDLPWLTPRANRFLETEIKSTDVGLEFGSGRSTLWFAGRVAHLTSVEHNPLWHERVSEWIKTSGITNVDYYLREREAVDGEDLPESSYVHVAHGLEEGSLDFVLVDGIYRGSCVLAVLQKIKQGGMLIIDNANLYLPSNSRAPNSLKMGSSPSNEYWGVFLQKTANWQVNWSGNGVSDTAIFLKP